MKHVFLLMLCAILHITSFSQLLSKAEQLFLVRTTDEYISKRDAVSYSRKPELIILVLPVDSSGKIASVSILSDEGQRDKVYDIAKSMTPTVFSRKAFESCIGKTIFLPVITINEREKVARSYVSALGMDLFEKYHNADYEKIGVVFTRPVYYFLPFNSEGYINEMKGSIAADGDDCVGDLLNVVPPLVNPYDTLRLTSKPGAGNTLQSSGIDLSEKKPRNEVVIYAKKEKPGKEAHLPLKNQLSYYNVTDSARKLTRRQ